MATSSEIRKVKKVQFGILRPEEIVRAVAFLVFSCWPRTHASVQREYAVCKIESADCMENGKPKEGGLMDARMGTTDKTYKCLTCAGSMSECPGHFGYLELAKPMFNIGFMDTTMKVLRCVCFHCSKLLANTVSGLRLLHVARSHLLRFSAE
jgi:DNA-directed RNA polymerase II subunit RPB1